MISLFRKKKIFKGNYAAFSPYDSIVLKLMVRSINKPFKRIIEIGSWAGNGSTTAIIEELRNEMVSFTVLTHGREAGMLRNIKTWYEIMICLALLCAM